MSNISNRLKGLFNAYLNRLDEERRNPPLYNRNPYYGCRPPMATPHQQRINFGDDDDEFQGIIYFYEWSDATRSPKTFYSLRAFENFLNANQIFMASYQKELIKHLHNPYVSCKVDGKDLHIKANWEALKQALEKERKEIPSPKGSEDKEPYAVAITRTPPIQMPQMVYETEGRWPESERIGDWFG